MVRLETQQCIEFLFFVFYFLAMRIWILYDKRFDLRTLLVMGSLWFSFVSDMRRLYDAPFRVCYVKGVVYTHCTSGNTARHCTSGKYHGMTLNPFFDKLLTLNHKYSNPETHTRNRGRSVFTRVFQVCWTTQSDLLNITYYQNIDNDLRLITKLIAKY